MLLPQRSAPVPAMALIVVLLIDAIFAITNENGSG